MNEKIIADGTYLLEKFPGKGGWTYAALPEVTPDKNAPFGWIRVCGTVDDYEIRNFHLMPMGNGMLFLSVNAAIRKVIKKSAGDTVRVILFRENPAGEVIDEFLECLRDEPRANEFFNTLTENEKNQVTEWISAAKTSDQQVERMAEAINMLATGKKLLSP